MNTQFPLYLFAVIGILTTTYFILIPITEMLFFGIGYMFLALLNADMSKIKKYPHKFPMFLFKYFLRGINTNIQSLGSVTSVEFGNWIWKPYFHYERKHKEEPL